MAAAAAPPRCLASTTQEQADAPQCRICLDTHEDATTGPLFRPCSCRGSAAWVHMECLDTWRKTSANRRSFYRCDTCHFEYKLQYQQRFLPDKFSLARFLNTRFAIHVLSLLVLSCMVFVGGFVAKAFNPGLTWWDVLRCLNLQHLISGAYLTGLGSLAGGVMSTVGGGTLFRFLGETGLRLGEVDGKLGAILVAILTVVGLCFAFAWIFGRVEAYAEGATGRMLWVVLDAHHGRSPPPVIASGVLAPAAPNVAAAVLDVAAAAPDEAAARLVRGRPARSPGRRRPAQG